MTQVLEFDSLQDFLNYCYAECPDVGEGCMRKCSLRSYLRKRHPDWFTEMK